VAGNASESGAKAHALQVLARLTNALARVLDRFRPDVTFKPNSVTNRRIVPDP